MRFILSYIVGVFSSISILIEEGIIQYSTQWWYCNRPNLELLLADIDRIEPVAYPHITFIPAFLLTFPFAIARCMFELARYAFKLNRYCLAICLKSIAMFELAAINLSLSLCNNLFEWNSPHKLLTIVITIVSL